MIGKSERRMARLAHVVLIVFSLMAVLPFILLISASLTEENAALKYGFGFIPKVFSLAAYKYISYQSKMIIRAYGITIFTTVIGTSVGLTMTSMLGYGLSKDIPGRRILNFFVVFTMLFNGGLVPTYLVYTKYLHLGNTIWALILPGAVPLGNVILLMNAFRGVPKSLEEAAMIDGGSQWVILLKVFLPVVKPTLAAVTLFTIVGHWNDYLSALVYITDTANYPLQTYIQQLNVDITEVTDPDKLEQLARISSRTLNSAKIVVSTIPLLMIYPFMQKYFVSGIVVGSVKE